MLVRMGDELGTILAWAVRTQAGRGPHAEVARQVVLAVVLAQLVAGAQHDGPPHAARRARARGGGPPDRGPAARGPARTAARPAQAAPAPASREPVGAPAARLN